MPEFKRYPGEDPEIAKARIEKNIEDAGIPMADARDRNESYQLGGQVQPPTVPSITPTPQYKKGGKVEK